MTFKTTRLRDAITFALAVGTIAGTGAAFAQATPATTDKSSDELDRVTVTGSRIRQIDKETSSPVLTIDRTQLEATGLTSVGDVLFNITASDGGALRNITTSTNGSDGTQNVSLRGLGATRTLVLVNGRRWVTDGSGTVDLNTIPLAVVERIEVLKDGASAIYGSDAIAGVINVITRKNFEGGEARAYLGEYSKGDGFQQSYDFTLGSNNDRVNTVFSISYTDQTPVLAKDRTISSVPHIGAGDLISGGAYGSGSTERGNFIRCVRPLANDAATGFQFCPNALGLPSGTGRTRPGLTLNEGRPGTATTDFRNFVGYTTDGSLHTDRYNFAPVNYLLQPIERFNVYGQGTLKLTDHVNANVQATYVKRRSEQQLAEVPLTLSVQGNNGPQYAFNPARTSVFNPFKNEDILSFNFRARAVGPRHNSYDVDSMAVTTSLDGDFDLFGRSMFWDVGYSYLDSKSNLRGSNYVNLFNLKNAVGPSRRNAVTGALECLDGGGKVIAGCTPYNLFGGPDLGLAAGVITQAQYDAMNNYIRYTLVETNEDKTKDYFANLSGDIVDLPAGPLGFAVGIEHRTESYYDQPDALVAGGGSSTNFRQPTSGNVSSDEEYAELNIPVLADVPFAKLLEVNLAARHTKYDSSGLIGTTQVQPDIGGDTSRKVGIKWKMFDQFLLRGTYSEAFRAPNVQDLFSGLQESFPSASDPCASNGGRFAALSAASQAKCVADGVPAGGYNQLNTQLRALSGGNPNLKPETSTTRSLGFVYSPTWLNNFEMTLDWYNIKLKDAVAFRGASSVLNSCYRSLDPFFCNFVKRDATGNINDLRQFSFNLANGEVEGYDLQLKYRLPETAYGRIGFQFDSTYQTKNDIFGTVGEYNGSPTWRLRSNLTTTWQMGDFDATWAMRYYSGLDEDCSGYESLFPNGAASFQLCSNTDPNTFNADRTAENHLGATTYHDIQLGWKTPWNAKVSIGARNAFGKEPPRTVSSFAHSFDGAYDLPQGGFYYMQYNQKF